MEGSEVAGRGNCASVPSVSLTSVFYVGREAGVSASGGGSVGPPELAG